MTENHSLNRPKQGALDWHLPLNENFESIDTGVEVRDVASERSSYDPKRGAKFLATDTGTRYLGNGSEWVEAPVHFGEVFNAPVMTSDPTDPRVGEVWYRSDLDEIRVQLANSIEKIV